ncbi:MAG: hypothetical protein Kow00121_59610 [Elainellaceae cyanobacterium]
MIELQFEWDEAKASTNLKKHGISFEEAKTVLSDPLAITISDPNYSDREDRYVDMDSHRKDGFSLLPIRSANPKFRLLAAVELLPESKEFMSNMNLELSQEPDDLLPEYDFSQGVRGKHNRAYRQGHTVTVHQADGTTTTRHFTLEEGAVMLDPDVREYFPDSESVNQALRTLIRLTSRNR